MLVDLGGVESEKSNRLRNFIPSFLFLFDVLFKNIEVLNKAIVLFEVKQRSEDIMQTPHVQIRVLLFHVGSSVEELYPIDGMFATVLKIEENIIIPNVRLTEVHFLKKRQTLAVDALQIGFEKFFDDD